MVDPDVLDQIVWLADRNKDYGDYYCPLCRPDVDPTERGRCWTLTYCDRHRPTITGTADPYVALPAVIPVIEAIGGEGP